MKKNKKLRFFLNLNLKWGKIQEKSYFSKNAKIQKVGKIEGVQNLNLQKLLANKQKNPDFPKNS